MRLLTHGRNIFAQSSAAIWKIYGDVYAHTKCPFIILIDEWDCLFREYKQDKEAQESISQSSKQKKTDRRKPK